MNKVESHVLPTFVTAKAPADVDMWVMLHRGNRLEMFSTHNVKASEIDAASWDAEVSNMKGSGTPYTS